MLYDIFRVEIDITNSFRLACIFAYVAISPFVFLLSILLRDKITYNWSQYDFYNKLCLYGIRGTANRMEDKKTGVAKRRLKIK